MGEVASDEAPNVLLADADVLIDYRDSDIAVLKDVGRRIARVAVLSHTLDEVHDVTKEDCAALGIEVIEVETPMLLAAAEGEAQVSFNDRLCFLVCREQRWTCVTNDRALRRCRAIGRRTTGRHVAHVLHVVLVLGGARGPSTRRTILRSATSVAVGLSSNRFGSV